MVPDNTGSEKMKPIKVSAGEFVTDSNFNVILFSENQAKSYARKMKKIISKQIGYDLKKHGVKDFGDYYTCSFV